MSQASKANPVIHELAVLLASKQEKKAVNPEDVKRFYGNYLIAVKTLTELDKDEEFKANPSPPPTRKRQMRIT
jgi:hypothetical protein